MAFPPKFIINNDGKWLEELLKVTHNAYLEKGIAKIEKVDPPVKVVGGRTGAPQMVALRNVFLDFIGSTHGQLVIMEAKSTSKPKLTLLRDGGVTARQWDCLAEWEHVGGAMCCVVWGYNGQLRFLSMEKMKAVLAEDRKTIQWEESDAIAQGEGYILNDWLLNLRAAYGYRGAQRINADKREAE